MLARQLGGISLPTFRIFLDCLILSFVYGTKWTLSPDVKCPEILQLEEFLIYLNINYENTTFK
jgi:hypothetical protein